MSLYEDISFFILGECPLYTKKAQKQQRGISKQKPILYIRTATKDRQCTNIDRRRSTYSKK